VVRKSGESGVPEAPTSGGKSVVVSKPGSVTVEGVHYGKEPGLKELSAARYGAGASKYAGEEWLLKVRSRRLLTMRGGMATEKSRIISIIRSCT